MTEETLTLAERMRRLRASRLTSPPVAVSPAMPFVPRSCETLARGLRTMRGREQLHEFFRVLDDARDNAERIRQAIAAAEKSGDGPDLREAAMLAERLSYYSPEMHAQAETLYRKALARFRATGNETAAAALEHELAVSADRGDFAAAESASGRIMGQTSLSARAEKFLEQENENAALAVIEEDWAEQRRDRRAGVSPEFCDLARGFRRRRPAWPLFPEIAAFCRRLVFDEHGAIRTDESPEEKLLALESARVLEEGKRELQEAREKVEDVRADMSRIRFQRTRHGWRIRKGAGSGDYRRLTEAQEKAATRRMDLEQLAEKLETMREETVAQRPLGDVCRAVARLLLEAGDQHAELYARFLDDCESTGDFTVAADLAEKLGDRERYETYRAAACVEDCATFG